MDLDKDGKISLPEVMAIVGDIGQDARELIETFFHTVDTNNNGLVEFNELIAFLKEVKY